MYCNFYSLENKPFELAPVGGLVYLSDAHREGIAMLRYGVVADKGFVLLTGGVGAGKTTVLNTLLDMVKDKVRVCVLNNPKLNRHEFYYYLSKKLGISYKGNKGDFIVQFTKLLDKYDRHGGKVLLIIDEAQVFPINLLEEIRLLSNHADARNVFSIFLIGQPELQQTLAHERLLPLRQRIGIRYHLTPLDRQDTAQYVLYRLNSAGAANPALFSAEAIDYIHLASQGNPRLINIICDHALLSGFAQDKLQIEKDIILECLEDIRLDGEESLQISEQSNHDQKSPERTSKLRVSKLTVTISLILFIAITIGAVYFFLSY